SQGQAAQLPTPRSRSITAAFPQRSGAELWRVDKASDRAPVSLLTETRARDHAQPTVSELSKYALGPSNDVAGVFTEPATLARGPLRRRAGQRSTAGHAYLFRPRSEPGPAGG
ncbi:unnamed protein product, partial [Ixodes persulcatus]